MGSERGMTLLEVVIGLTIVGMALAAGTAALASVVDHRARVDAVTGEVISAATARRTLIGWLAGARLRPEGGGPSFTGLDGTLDGRPDDELTFLTEADTPLGPGGETIVRLFVDRDKETATRGLTAEFREWRGSRSAVIAIDSAVTVLDIIYFTRIVAGHETLPSWVSSTLLPQGIEVRLSGVDSLPVAPLLALPLRVPLGVLQ